MATIEELRERRKQGWDSLMWWVEYVNAAKRRAVDDYTDKVFAEGLAQLIDAAIAYRAAGQEEPAIEWGPVDAARLSEYERRVLSVVWRPNTEGELADKVCFEEIAAETLLNPDIVLKVIVELVEANLIHVVEGTAPDDLQVAAGRKGLERLDLGQPAVGLL